MTRMNRRAIAAFAVAPFAPPVLFWALCVPPEIMRTSTWDSLWPLLVGSIFTYPIMLVIGVPAYVLLASHGVLRLKHVLPISGTVGLIAGMIMSWIRGGVPLGLSAGVTFWLIWHRCEDEPPLF